MMPYRLRFAVAQNVHGMRPVSRGLERVLDQWLLEACGADTRDDAAIAGRIAAEIGPGETLVMALASGAGVHHFTHYSGWRPDHSWISNAEWGARLELVAETPDEYARDLGHVAAWMVVPDPDKAFRSVLLACPETDIMNGRWWRYAAGSLGAPMPTVDLGERLFGDEMYWMLGGDEVRAPTIRELSLGRRDYFAIDGGPVGYVRFADPDGVGHSSAFFDGVTSEFLAYRRSVMEREDWADVEDGFARIRQMLPRIQGFYDRAWTSGYWVVHFGIAPDVEPPAAELRITPRHGVTPGERTPRGSQ